MIKVLFATSEASPFAKSGGLGDIAGSLPYALDPDEVDIRIVMPKYGCIPDEYKKKMKFIKAIDVMLSWRNQYCGILEMEYNGITVYFIDNEFYFGSRNMYGYIHEDMEKFAFFSKSVLSMLPDIDFRPDIIHCNDWQTGAIPVLLNAQFQDNEFYQGIKTIMTIHNLRYQGIWDKHAVDDVLGLDYATYFTNDKLEYKGDINLLKGGLVYADVITTVSETYANEIQTEQYGEGLDGLLRAKSGCLHGILNGLSYREYSPATDELIYKKYNGRNFITGKRANKLALQQQLGLAVTDDVPMFSMISRLVGQKGLDIISHIITELSRHNIQLVVLGTGEEHFENMFRWFAGKNPDKISANICFSNELAHKIYAASDAFLMPSEFEPCGLSQIISMKYGTLPLVRETGGLRDTVIPYNEYTGEGNGFSFGPYDGNDLLNVISYAEKVYQNKTAWHGIMRNAMKADFSWAVSAQKYLDLYNSLIN